MASIDIFCPLGKNAKPYAEFMRKTGLVFASQKHNLQWKCVKTTSHEMAYDESEPPNGFNVAGSVVNYNASPYHCMVQKMENGQKATIIDADIAILYQDWDDVMYSLLQDKVAIVGSAHSRNSSNYQNFPNLCICMVDTDVIKSLNINLDSKSYTKVKNKMESRITKLNVGSRLERDTGWMLPFAYTKAGYKGVHLPEVIWTEGILKKHMTKKEKSILKTQNPSKIMSEQHFDKKIFSCHFRHSHHRSWSGDLAECFKEIIKRYIKDTTGKEIE